MNSIHAVMKMQHDASQRGVLSMWTIYDHPLDYPDVFIARRWEAGAVGVQHTTDTIVSHDVKILRDVFIHAGLTKVMRHESDDLNIMEVWL